VRLTDRTRSVRDSPIAEAHAWVAARSTQRPLLDLSQAAPRYPPAPEVVAGLTRALAAPDGSRYAPSYGLPALRAAIAEDLAGAYGATVPPDRVLVTAGCNQAFTVTVSSLAAPGDEVIVPVPFYFNHDMWLRLDGIRPVYLPCGDDGVPSVEQAERLVTDRTRALVLVTPNNPTGAVYPPEVIASFARLARDHDLALILDETYRTFRGTDTAPHHLLTGHGWEATVVSLHSYSKDLAIPGHRVGAVVGSPELLAQAVKALDCVAICAPRPGQEATLAGLREAGSWRRHQAGAVARRLADFRAVMAHTPGGFELRASGAFFGWVRHPFTGEPSGAVARRLLDEHDLLVIPGDAFLPDGDDQALRFSFANLDPADLLEVGRRLEAAGH
jgi:aspartate/methionine/tyrosine aminotransferase